jgi:hypothetical protein
LTSPRYSDGLASTGMADTVYLPQAISEHEFLSESKGDLTHSEMEFESGSRFKSIDYMTVSMDVSCDVVDLFREIHLSNISPSTAVETRTYPHCRVFLSHVSMTVIWSSGTCDISKCSSQRS